MTRVRSSLPPRQAGAPTLEPRAARHRTGAACLVGVLCFAVYLSNLRPMGAWDSVPARLLPFSILREGNLNLDEFAWLRRLDRKPYFMRQTPSGHWLSGYSVGVPVLVTPLYAPVVWWLQRHQIADDDVRFRLATVIMERIAAALIAALSVSLVFLALSASTSTALAAGVTLVYGLGTSLWTIGSQALWQHGLAALGLAGLNVFLLAADTRRNAVGAGACAALAVLARPTMAVFALLALVFVWRERRGCLPAFLSVPAAGLALLLAYDVRLVGLFSGIYQRGRFRMPALVGFAGLLISPSRGLLVYTPAAAVAFAALLRREPRGPRWVAYLPFGVAGYLLLYSAWVGWWGGHCYGPRFLTDVLPALAVCAAPTVESWWRFRWRRALLGLLALWGVAVQAIGVYFDDRSWDAVPKSINATTGRLWDLRDPQILRAARSGWHGTQLAPLLWQMLTDPQPAVLRTLKASELAGEVALDDAPPSSYRAGRTSGVRLRVTNRSEVTWPAFSDFGYLQVALVYSWWRDGAMVKGEGGFVALPRNLPAGASDLVAARIDAPRRHGTYELQFALVQVITPAEGASGGAVLRLPARVE